MFAFLIDFILECMCILHNNNNKRVFSFLWNSCHAMFCIIVWFFLKRKILITFKATENSWSLEKLETILLEIIPFASTKHFKHVKKGTFTVVFVWDQSGYILSKNERSDLMVLLKETVFKSGIKVLEKCFRRNSFFRKVAGHRYFSSILIADLPSFF